MSEYACFLHPLEKGASLDDVCSKCGLKFGFPLLDGYRPKRINEKDVDEAISRGFYGAVYRTTHPRTRRSHAVKVIPVATYAPADQGGYGKSFEDEANFHNELFNSPLVARLEDWGQEALKFGESSIDCYWLEMEFVSGPTLDDVITKGPKSPREVAQIAWDLVDLLEELKKRKRFHNDLHSKNIFVVDLSKTEARRDAIDPNVQVKVVDLNSAGDESKSTHLRLSDTHWVAWHILDLTSAYERMHRPTDPASIRICAQLRRVAEHYFGDQARAPTPGDLKRAIHSAYSFGQRPWHQPAQLESIGRHYNAQTLPSWFAPSLFYDPGRKWEDRLTQPGPQLVSGMRGCGKTILLRSLEWVARIQPRPVKGKVDKEKRAAVVARVRKESFLGLFVSCSSLLQGPRASQVKAPVHRTFLAFAREIIRDVEICQLENIGVVNYPALEPFSNLIAAAIPWYQRPNDPSDVWQLERALTDAVNHEVAATSGNLEFNARRSFDELARLTKDLVDIWSNKILLFLLDDVSTRVLLADDVTLFLSQLCLQSPDFGFKISTETQTLQLISSGGEIARPGRDYQQFDLGAEVLKHLGGKQGASFVSHILDRRAAHLAAPRADATLAQNVLGTCSLDDIAKSIRERKSGGKRETATHYYGVEALAGLCVGDVGELLQLYETMLERHGDSVPFPIDRKIQHSVLVEIAENRLRALSSRDRWLFAHAQAFAQASNRELLADKKRLRHFTSIHINVDAERAEEVFTSIWKLVDGGVFVFVGGTTRAKRKSGRFSLQFKLSFNKILGLPYGVPLGRRDRFEPESMAKLEDWLNSPAPEKLTWGHLPKSTEPEANGDEPEDGATEPVQLHLAARRGSSGEVFPAPHALYRVTTKAAGLLRELVVDWSNKHVVAAYGFEDRSLGAWRALLQKSKPSQATMLEYPDSGLKPDISKELKKHRVSMQEISTRQEHNTLLDRILGSVAVGEELVLDTTSLTKALIFALVGEGLRRFGKVWVLHTCAETYFPPQADLDELAQQLDNIETPLFERLDAILQGESEPYTTVSVGRVARDPSLPSLLAAFVPLKFSRLRQVLEDITVERIAAIIPVHSDGHESSRTRLAAYVAEYFVQLYGGTSFKVPSLDHQEAFNVLSKLHAEYALNGGYNFEIALTGTKMHAVAAGMLAATSPLAGVYYSRPASFKKDKFTGGSAQTRLICLERSEISVIHPASSPAQSASGKRRDVPKLG